MAHFRGNRSASGGRLVAILGDAGTFWLYGVIAIAAWIFFYRLVPETNGKTLEQIEAYMRSGKHPRGLRKRVPEHRFTIFLEEVTSAVVYQQLPGFVLSRKAG